MYKLRLPPQWKIHDVFHGKTLTPYRETEVHGKNFPEPPPDLINREEEFEVDSIWDHRKRGRGYLYLVRWKGYPDETWEPERNTKNSSEILEEYKRRKKLQWYFRQSSKHVKQTQQLPYHQHSKHVLNSLRFCFLLHHPPLCWKDFQQRKIHPCLSLWMQEQPYPHPRPPNHFGSETIGTPINNQREILGPEYI